MKASIALVFFSTIAQVFPASAQAVLFDFDNAPLSSSLPISQTVSGITAHFSATGEGYSIQEANVLGFVPLGFAGRVIYPNSINLADLLIRFDQAITDFSIMYSCQELGCDDAATMRVTAYLKGSLAGTSTRTASHPGTWPVDTLRCSFPQGMDSLVVHYDSHPPTCQDYGVIFLADNMRVTALLATATGKQNSFTGGIILPNPVLQSTTISFSLFQSENVTVTVYDIEGNLVKRLFEGPLNPGDHKINWNINDDAIEGGIYFLKLAGEDFFRSYKLVVVK